MSREITQCMLRFSETGENRAVATFLFPPDFIGFQGHFPGEPVLPGVCEIQALLVLLSFWRSKRVTLEAVRRAKFLAPIGSDEEVVVGCEVTDEDGGTVARATVSVAGIEKAVLWIEVSTQDR